MTAETTWRHHDEARDAEEPVFGHLDNTERPDLRTIASMAKLLNLGQQTVRFAVNRLERNGRIFGEGQGTDGAETWRTENTPPSLSQVVL